MREGRGFPQRALRGRCGSIPPPTRSSSSQRRWPRAGVTEGRQAAWRTRARRKTARRLRRRWCRPPRRILCDGRWGRGRWCCRRPRSGAGERTSSGGQGWVTRLGDKADTVATVSAARTCVQREAQMVLMSVLPATPSPASARRWRWNGDGWAEAVTRMKPRRSHPGSDQQVDDEVLFFFASI